MTKNELSQLFYLNREIEQEKRRLLELQSVSTGIAAKITGLPHVRDISNKTALAAEIVDSKAVIEAKLQLAVVEFNRLNRYIMTIEDSMMRQILSLRFVDGLSWRQVANSIGGGNTADGVRMACYRFLREK